MKTPFCPNSQCDSHAQKSHQVIGNGTYFRNSDQQNVQRYVCKCCKKRFSEATNVPTYWQKKRFLNDPIMDHLCSGTSMRRIAMLLGINRKTVANRLIFWSRVCRDLNNELLKERGPSEHIQFDEMETFEHTKCKPLAIALAVQHPTRLILGTQIAVMSAKGKLARLARKKYGLRKSERRKGLKALLTSIKPHLQPKFMVESDKCPLYPSVLGRVFAQKEVDEKQRIQSNNQPTAVWDVTYRRYKGGRGCITGQGEMKKLKFDPLFSLNHTAAMLRANINRLFRRTWNTTKKRESLQHHINIYAYFHNSRLIPG